MKKKVENKNSSDKTNKPYKYYIIFNENYELPTSISAHCLLYTAILTLVAREASN